MPTFKVFCMPAYMIQNYLQFCILFCETFFRSAEFLNLFFDETSDITKKSQYGVYGSCYNREEKMMVKDILVYVRKRFKYLINLDTFWQILNEKYTRKR